MGLILYIKSGVNNNHHERHEDNEEKKLYVLHVLHGKKKDYQMVKYIILVDSEPEQKSIS